MPLFLNEQNRIKKFEKSILNIIARIGYSLGNLFIFYSHTGVYFVRYYAAIGIENIIIFLVFYLSNTKNPYKHLYFMFITYGIVSYIFGFLIQFIYVSIYLKKLKT